MKTKTEKLSDLTQWIQNQGLGRRPNSFPTYLKTQQDKPSLPFISNDILHMVALLICIDAITSKNPLLIIYEFISNLMTEDEKGK